ncbi:hypothetical protein LOTGIDRAFT_238177 [Lottia gigantea]|uniref:EF-hand domain-containing protein n=1 Tax=Lottia gigantea TaxID=225164 RepID=V4AW66_LOTGI|nr:hypothetical protein LOTGIDRAFT_238177 [Lottia gigantea]ESP01698.1 hypothetical protein LOTGIDRAFT_238177 [Lottia gigantea]
MTQNISCILTSSIPFDPDRRSTVDVVKKFKDIVRKSSAGLFDHADSNHNNEFDQDDMKHLFVEYDTDKDSKVSEAEFIAGFAAREPNVTIVAKGLFLELDMDKSGYVTDSDLPLYFHKIDQNKDGKVSKLEFEDYFTELFTILYVLKVKSNQTAG